MAKARRANRDCNSLAGMFQCPPACPCTCMRRGDLMANWFSGMTVRERRTFWACFSGWALDAMDVQLYAVVMPTLIALWGLSRTQAGTLGTAALLFSSAGGWIAGILPDRVGRAAGLQVTIVWFAGFTFPSGVT